MSYNDVNYEWTKKGGTLSDKTAFKEFGLTQNDIIKAIHEGKLQFREGSIYGNPYLRLPSLVQSCRLNRNVFRLQQGKTARTLNVPKVLIQATSLN